MLNSLFLSLLAELRPTLPPGTAPDPKRAPDPPPNDDHERYQALSTNAVVLDEDDTDSGRSADGVVRDGRLRASPVPIRRRQTTHHCTCLVDHHACPAHGMAKARAAQEKRARKAAVRRQAAEAAALARYEERDTEVGDG